MVEVKISWQNNLLKQMYKKIYIIVKYFTIFNNTNVLDNQHVLLFSHALSMLFQ